MCTEGASLVLRGGDYLVPEPISLVGVSAGPSSRILVTSAAGESANILGRVPLTMTPVSPSDPAARFFAPGVAARALVGAAPAGELYWRGVPQVEARWPNDWVALAWASQNASVAAEGTAGCVSTPSEPFLCAGFARTAPGGWTWWGVTTSPDVPFGNWSWGGSWRAHGLFTYDWSDTTDVVASYSAENHSLLFAQPDNAGYWGGECVQGLLSFFSLLHAHYPGTRYVALGAPEVGKDIC